MATEIFAVGTKNGKEVFGSASRPPVVLREAFGPMRKEGFEIFSSAAPRLPGLSTVVTDFIVVLPVRNKINILRR